MRKFWVVLLSVGLIVALTAPVLAADVKFSGSYVIQGYYEDNRRIAEIPGSTLASSQRGPSDSFTWQRLRVGTVFQVAEGLSLTTRFDAMEKVWGAARGVSVPGVGATYATAYDSNGIQIPGSGEAENIKFQHVYVTFNTGIGRFIAGYYPQNAFGTSFANSSDYAYGPRLRWDITTGPWMFALYWDKYEGQDNSYASIGTANPQVDASKDKYQAFAIYNWGKGEAGMQLQYAIETRASGVTGAADSDTSNYKKSSYKITPYMKAAFGPTYVEAEIIYTWGKQRIWETSSSRTDITYTGLSAYAMAKVDLKPAYVGGIFFYVSGDDAGTTDKIESGNPSGSDFNPCLILGNYDLNRWSGGMGNSNVFGGTTYNTALTRAAANPLGGYSGVGLDNIWAYQVFVGVTPVPKLDTRLAITYAYFDRTPSTTGPSISYTTPNNGSDGAWVSKNLGFEADLTATYKIYDNLSYMIGFGYLWAGDAFKGTNIAADVKNDYLLTHKLTLSF
ncbi:MAG TPA: alginate export family protein [Syntrophales bacterium]|nr:alginate export family protein [Syntrophales bacterium]